MADTTKRKDNQLADTMAMLDTKDEQMSDLIMQITTSKINTGRRRNADNKPQSQCGPKRRVGGGGRPEVKQGGAQKLKTKNGLWTRKKKVGFTITFDHMNHKWDGSWPNDKKAYYNACKKVQVEGQKRREINESGAKNEPIKAKQVAELKRQLAALE